jgi:hypothetical protein
VRDVWTFIRTQYHCRLLQPCNFVHLNAFAGYKPFSVTELNSAKAGKGMSAGAWYKKVWTVYSKVEPTESKIAVQFRVSAVAPKQTGAPQINVQPGRVTTTRASE